MRGLDVFTRHGGRVEAARAAFGGEDWIDLSTGIAPWPYPLPPDAIAAFARLPEPDALTDLEAAATSAFGCAPGREAVAVPGSDLALRLLAGAIDARPVAVVQPGYAGHAAAWPDADAVADAAAVAGHRCLVLADPANPDGRRANPALLHGLAQAGVTIVIDEAFADSDDRAGFAASADDRIVVLRSFGKFYGLPGLRLGFVLATARIAATIRRALGDWPVSGAAIAIGRTAYRDARWRQDQQDRIAIAGERLDAAIGDVAIVGGAALFRLIETSDAQRLFAHLADRAILTRPFADRPTHLRVGLPRDAAAAHRLATAVSEYAA